MRRENTPYTEGTHKQNVRGIDAKQPRRKQGLTQALECEI